MWLLWPLKCHNCSQETLNFLHDGMFAHFSGSLCGSAGKTRQWLLFPIMRAWKWLTHGPLTKHLQLNHRHDH
jgi:hypothetical protein